MDDPALVILAAAALVDVAVGEPPNAVHPVVWMGRTTTWLVARAPRRGPMAQLAAGAGIAVVVPATFAAGAALAIAYAPAIVVGTWLLKSSAAGRALGRAGLEVARPLARGDLAAGRTALQSLCSRDPSHLDASQVAAAAVESVAENASDSVVAPLFYYALFGLPGAVAYRAVNTLDAMIGYRGRYEYLGKAAARLDDVLNWIPARITAGLLLVAGALSGVSGARVRDGWRILRRDGGATESPNAGRPMATMAGLLGVRLDKVGHYRLGDPTVAVTAATIRSAWRIVALAMVLAVLSCAAAIAVRGAISW
ncbi:MAG TPA: adenosylcobinamide-phosphate synthase CbiB [Kofleriaceae bacterium]|nr:adenosylcobinamide-phosphate synthase CbiB [Kofleriaceae bacterium]